jgi:hypothetical protein
LLALVEDRLDGDAVGLVFAELGDEGGEDVAADAHRPRLWVPGGGFLEFGEVFGGDAAGAGALGHGSARFQSACSDVRLSSQ